MLGRMVQGHDFTGRLLLLDILSGILVNIISGKILMISKKRSQKSSSNQKHRELQLTVFLGFQAACVLSGIF